MTRHSAKDPDISHLAKSVPVHGDMCHCRFKKVPCLNFTDGSHNVSAVYVITTCDRDSKRSLARYVRQTVPLANSRITQAKELISRSIRPEAS